MKLTLIAALSFAAMAAAKGRVSVMDTVYKCDQGYKYCGHNLLDDGWTEEKLKHWSQSAGVGGGDIKNYLFDCLYSRVPLFSHYCKYGCISGGEEYDDYCLLEPSKSSVHIQL